DPLAFALDEKNSPLDPATRRHVDGSIDDAYAVNAGQGIHLDQHIQRAIHEARKGGQPKPGGGLKSALASVRERLVALRGEIAASGRDRGPELDFCDTLLKDPKLAELGMTADGKAKTPEEPGPGRDLSGDDLSGQDLSGRDLTGAN